MPDTSPSPSSLESVPLHILEDIVHQLDQLSIWRMRKTSRYIRDIADTALEPFLDDIKVIGNPPIIKHGELPSQEARRKEGWNGLELIAVFKPVDPELLNTLRERHSRLKRKNKLLHSHLTVHPRTAPSTLTVEVRDDDERTGWRVLRRVEPRNLELHIVDRYCTQQQFELDGLEQDEGVDEQDDWCDWWNDTPDLMLDYNRYNGILGSPEKSRFDSLQSFTVAATSRGLHHLRQLAPYLPNLRELTFSCHWSGDYGYTIFTDIEGGLRLPMLECLTVSGCDTNYAAFAAGRIALHARRLSKVVLHSAAYNARQFSAGFDSMVVDLAKRTALCSIALYGYMARFFLDKAARWRHEVTYPFPHLTSIALERYHDGVHASPMHASLPSLLPALESITYIDTQTNQYGVYNLGTLDRTGYSDFFDDTALDNLFAANPKLRCVQWIVGYPKDDPFIFTPRETWQERNVRCCVVKLDLDAEVDRETAAETVNGLWRRRT